MFQQRGGTMKLGDMFVHWNQVRADLLTTIDKFGDEELSFVPFEGSWPVGKIMLHIAETEDGWLHTLVQRQLDPGVDYELADYPTKSAIKSVLDRARSRTVPLLDRLTERDLDTVYTLRNESLTLRWIIWHVLEHEIHHRGELSLALGLLGREGLDV
jgi:uncharacterized damage-inducible protein DinB